MQPARSLAARGQSLSLLRQRKQPKKGNPNAALDVERDAKISAIRAEFTPYRGEVAADIYRAKQESRITNVELEYQRKIDAQERYISQIETRQAAHEKRKPD